MKEGVPKIAIGWTLALYGGVVILLLTIGYLRPVSTSAMLALIAGSIALGIFLVPVLSTRVTDVGISQRGFRGRKDLRWCEIQSVEILANAIVLVGEKCRIHVLLVFFHDFDSAFSYIDEHVPAALRSGADAR